MSTDTNPTAETKPIDRQSTRMATDPRVVYDLMRFLLRDRTDGTVEGVLGRYVDRRLAAKRHYCPTLRPWVVSGHGARCFSLRIGDTVISFTRECEIKVDAGSDQRCTDCETHIKEINAEIQGLLNSDDHSHAVNALKRVLICRKEWTRSELDKDAEKDDPTDSSEALLGSVFIRELLEVKYRDLFIEYLKQVPIIAVQIYDPFLHAFYHRGFGNNRSRDSRMVDAILKDFQSHVAEVRHGYPLRYVHSLPQSINSSEGLKRIWNTRQPLLGEPAPLVQEPDDRQLFEKAMFVAVSERPKLFAMPLTYKAQVRGVIGFIFNEAKEATCMDLLLQMSSTIDELISVELEREYERRFIEKVTNEMGEEDEGTVLLKWLPYLLNTPWAQIQSSQWIPILEYHLPGQKNDNKGQEENKRMKDEIGLRWQLLDFAADQAWRPSPGSFASSGKIRTIRSADEPRGHGLAYWPGSFIRLEVPTKDSELYLVAGIHATFDSVSQFETDFRDKIETAVGALRQRNKNRAGWFAEESYSRVAHLATLEEEAIGVLDKLDELRDRAFRLRAKISPAFDGLLALHSDLQVLFKQDRTLCLVCQGKGEAHENACSLNFDSIRDSIRTGRGNTLSRKGHSFRLQQPPPGGKVELKAVHVPERDAGFLEKWLDYRAVLWALSCNLDIDFLEKLSLVPTPDVEQARRAFRLLKNLILRVHYPKYTHEKPKYARVNGVQLLVAILDARSGIGVHCDSNSTETTATSLDDLLRTLVRGTPSFGDWLVDNDDEAVEATLPFGSTPVRFLDSLWRLIRIELAPQEGSEQRVVCDEIHVRDDANAGTLCVKLCCRNHLDPSDLTSGEGASVHGLSGAISALAAAVGVQTPVFESSQPFVIRTFMNEAHAPRTDFDIWLPKYIPGGRQR